MKDSKQINITILGAAGLIGKRHVDHIRKDERAKVHSIVDPMPGAQTIAKELGVPIYSNLKELFASPSSYEDLHAAIIATPTGMHIDQACQLIKKGIHVLIEKPLCNTVEEASPLVKASQEPNAGSILIGFHRRFNPYIVQFKNVLQQNPLGSIVAINGLWCSRKPKSYFDQAPWRSQKQLGGGVILTNLSHELDLMRFLFGEIQQVFCQTGNNTRGFDVEETCAITLKFENGFIGTFILSDSALTPYSFESATGENPNLSKHHQPIYTIMGTKGTLNFPNMEHWCFRGEEGEGDWTLPLTKSYQKALPFDDEYATDQGPNSPFTKRLNHWINFIQGKEDKLSCTLQDGLRNMILLDAILKSARTGLPVVV